MNLKDVCTLKNTQSLTLVNDAFDDFQYLETHEAILKGHQDIKLGDLLFVSRDPVERSLTWDNYAEINGRTHMCQLVLVSEIRHKWFGDLTDRDARRGGYPNALATYFMMKKSNPDLEESSEITIIKFAPV